MTRRLLMMVVALTGATTSFGQSSLFKIDLSTRSNSAPTDLSDASYKQFEQNMLNLTSANRKERIAMGLQKADIPYIVPGIVRFFKNGYMMPTGGRTRGNGITLVIDSNFNSSNDPTRATFMQSVYDTAQNLGLFDLYFGGAAISGTVNVINADATVGGIGDRQAITGGYYLPNNGTGGREIRMPLNFSREVAAVALIHCVLLAYLPDPAYGFDGYLEGLVRAATAKIVRNGSFQTTLGLDSEVVESVLEQTYEIGPFYDWTNQRSLGGPQFIAPNLLSGSIAQGTRGGLFFQRYQMAGSVWEKMLTEHPTFIKDLNALYASNTSASNNAAMLESLASTVLGAGTVEGDSFSVWVRKQHILDTRLTVGTKLHSLITPITAGLSGTDFGVFNIETTLFSTDSSGNETLLSGTSYPVAWDKDYNRLFLSSQAERIDIAASYGSSVPNFPSNSTNTDPYRVALDVPALDHIVRQYLPVGCIATPASSMPSNFYGTVVGFPVPTGGSLKIRVQYGSQTFDVPVVDYAFGSVVADTGFQNALSTTIKVIGVDASNVESVLLTRIVDKGPGDLAVQLGNDPVKTTGFPNGVTAGIQMIGFSGEPLYSGLENIFNTTDFLAARYNPSKTNYDLYPNSGAILNGQAYFLRAPQAGIPLWQARVETGTALAVALRPGWNMITSPLGIDVPLTNVSVVHATDIPLSYASASGNDASGITPVLGKDFFEFAPGANDAVTGVPEGGTYNPGASFAAGHGYFVRCLAPEGAVLLFSPDSAQSFHKLSAPVSSISHLLEVRFSRQGEASYARIGQSPSATTGFDAKLDSNLPPSIGGLQVAVQNGDLRFQDVKPRNTVVTSRVVASGLVPGQKYTINLTTKVGRATQLQLKDLQTGQMRYYAASFGSFVFTATKSTMSFDVTVRGAR
ncbi:MAG: hypothetical protein GC165_06360 [Armatimonadetes bacterium]|nr:hypothetical protein [Armatimonadota bacterium]